MEADGNEHSKWHLIIHLLYIYYLRNSNKGLFDILPNMAAELESH